MKATVYELKPTEAAQDLLVYFEAILLTLHNGGHLNDYWFDNGALMVSVRDED